MHPAAPQLHHVPDMVHLRGADQGAVFHADPGQQHGIGVGIGLADPAAVEQHIRDLPALEAQIVKVVVHQPVMQNLGLLTVGHIGADIVLDDPVRLFPHAADLISHHAVHAVVILQAVAEGEAFRVGARLAVDHKIPARAGKVLHHQRVDLRGNPHAGIAPVALHPLAARHLADPAAARLHPVSLQHAGRHRAAHRQHQQKRQRQPP